MKTLKEYYDSLPEIGRANLIAEASKWLVLLQKRKDKALKIELETPTHSSRSKRTTVYANSQKITDQYIKQVDFIKDLAKLL